MNCIKNWGYQSLKKLYFFILSSRILFPIASRINHLFIRLFGMKYENFFLSVDKSFHTPKIQENNLNIPFFQKLDWHYDIKSTIFENPLISIIVPNYNHEAYLVERLDSIYSQTYKNYEVILLDDCSTDNSSKIMESYAEDHKENTVLIKNNENSGVIFNQWNKGIKAANGELIWIAESDDYSSPYFLEKMVCLFQYDSVMLAFARCDFMRNGKKIWSTEEYLSDLPDLHWDKPFYMTAHNLVQNGFAIHNIIPNVSSCLFRNIKNIPQSIQSLCSSMRLSGDWIFYLFLAQGGVVAYTNEVTNFYRIHPQSTSLAVQQTDRYYREFEQVSCFIAENYSVNPDVFYKVLQNLKSHYRNMAHTRDDSIVEEYYSLEKILYSQVHRSPSVLMACYSLISGGGETYPIILANELRRQGKSVTLLNMGIEPTDKEIRKLVDPGLPLINIPNCDSLGTIIQHLGIDIVHSHHASVDEALAKWINANPRLCKHVITLHGMYESILPRHCLHTIEETFKSCNQYIYIADKNLDCFKTYGYYEEEKFHKLPNGLPRIAFTPISRESLNIEEDAFLLTLVSRGIPEKGWVEAIEAVKAAREHSNIPIHLIIVGGDPMYSRLLHRVPPYVHLMGTQNNPRDYFAAADAGILPTRFPGESFPLTIIECLFTGTPIIATDIAEVKNQLQDENGNMAGCLLTLKDWKLDIKQMEETILTLIYNKDTYNLLKSRTFSASKKFEIANVVKQYLSVYNNVMNTERKAINT